MYLTSLTDRNPRKSHNRGRESDRPLPVSRTARERRLGPNRYFVRRDGIHREILQKHICNFLGPETYFNPSIYKVAVPLPTCWGGKLISQAR